jgi:AraC-like DNA-binding protein
LFSWQGSGLPDYTPIERRLPLLENSVIQVRPGPFVAGAKIISGGGATVIRSFVKPHSVGVIVLDPSTVGFLVPLRWADSFRIDGVAAAPNMMHMAGEGDVAHTRGGQREQFGCILNRARFVETVSALRGVDPDELPLTERALAMAPNAYARLKDGLRDAFARFLHTGTVAKSPGIEADFTDRIFELLIDAYLDARPEPMPKSGRIRNAGRIVRAAEERFAQAGKNAISLADLCAAASVGKTALYVAFESYCGESPIAYFHKRRLTTARTRLLESDRQAGAVTRVALGVGLTELGRFARDYRRLYGESPSVTLKRTAP